MSCDDSTIPSRVVTGVATAFVALLAMASGPG